MKKAYIVRSKKDAEIHFEFKTRKEANEFIEYELANPGFAIDESEKKFYMSQYEVIKE